MSEDSNVLVVSQVKKVLQKMVEDESRYASEASQAKLGRVLTIIDAAISDPEQRKATKDLVKSTWYDGNLWASANSSSLELACEALGFELWDNSSLSIAHTASKLHNPYKELVK